MCVCVCEGSKTEREFWKLAIVRSRGTYVCVCDTLACQTRVCVCVCVCVCVYAQQDGEGVLEASQREFHRDLLFPSSDLSVLDYKMGTPTLEWL